VATLTALRFELVYLIVFSKPQQMLLPQALLQFKNVIRAGMVNILTFQLKSL
jgi:hypothetical protein